ncbi:MAG TPA: cysteine desulfurase [Chloroflexota bacterium]|nr:cysteine desulfurase [Chloroflexota bacterium]
MAVIDGVQAPQGVDTPLDVASIRRDFPILSTEINGHPLVYLDNGATSQKPRQVIDALVRYYTQDNANVHRSAHTLGVRVSEQYEGARAKLARFIGAPSASEVVFTRNTTEALNLVAYSWGMQHIGPGDEIVLSQFEHHSNLVPWQQLAMVKGAQLKFVPLPPSYEFDLAAYAELLTPRVKLVAVPHVSNVLGTVVPVAEVSRLAHQVGAVVVVDGAQSAPHMPVDLAALGCDFFALSSHKMLGPTGVGVLWGRMALLEEMPPFLTGGMMIGDVEWTKSTWAPVPTKFEAGTPNIADVIAFGAAVDYLEALGMDRVRQHERELTRYALEVLPQAHPEIEIYGPQDLDLRGGVISFNLRSREGLVHAHDVAQILDEQGIAIRASHHCAAPLHRVLDCAASARASFYVYNTEAEVDALVRGLGEVKRVFRRVLARSE